MDRHFRLLGDANRLRMISILSRGPLNVSEICSVLGLKQSNASHHLKKLLDAGFVVRTGRSGWVYYDLNASDGFVSEISSLLRKWSGRIPEYGSDLIRLAACYEQRAKRSQEFFDRSATRWNSLAEMLPDPEDYLSDLVRVLPKDGVIAEMGCGTGELLPELARISARVIGVDHSEGMLSRARELVSADALGRRIELRLGRAEHLPLGDSSADAIVAHMVLHHLPEPPAAIAEAARVLRQGGRLAVVELTPHDDLELREAHGDLWPGFGAEQLEEWIAASGFSIVSATQVSSGKAVLICSELGSKGEGFATD